MNAHNFAHERMMIDNIHSKEATPMRQRKPDHNMQRDFPENESPPVPTRRHRKPTEDTNDNNNSPATSSTAKPTPKKTNKRGRPSTSRSLTKPTTKNDPKAKEALIQDIESYWGKNFIKAYIPKCHRPLAKHSTSGKRLVPRRYETEPKNWLPATLKGMLMIARHTDDKKWLRKAIGDVVRYRIKHTGNRKPQLVTTDFDVIDDMLVKGWSVEYAFAIRYKHLLVGRKEELRGDGDEDGEEEEEDIEHILLVSSSSENDEDEDEDEDEENGDREKEDNGDDDNDGLGHHSSTNARSRFSPSTPLEPRKKNLKHPSASTPLHQTGILPPHRPFQPNDHAYPYGATMDHWGRPTLGYTGYPGYHSEQYAAGSAARLRENAYGAQTHSRYGMFPAPPAPQGRSARGMLHGRVGEERGGNGEDGAQDQSGGEAREESMEEGFESSGIVGRGDGDDMRDDDDADVEDEDDDDLDAELAAAEAELKVARLRAAKKARMAMKKDAGRSSA
ncbi:hypothetical protein ACJQWK_01921 [Exserohilum turcicum]